MTYTRSPIPASSAGGPDSRNQARLGSAPWILRACARWDHWWYRDAPPHALALFRIVFGAFLFLYWATLLPAVPMLFSEEGISLPLYEEGLPSFALTLLQPPPVWIAWILYGTLLLSFLLIVIGLCSRTASIVALLLHGYTYLSSHHLSWFTFEQLSVFFLLVLACSTATLLGAGWQKIVLPDWQGGEILSYALMNRWSTPSAYALVRLHLPIWLYDRTVNVVTIFEVLLPFGLWTRHRWWWIGGLFAFLLGVAILFGFFWFLVLVPACVTLWEPEEVHAWLRRVSRGRIR